MKKKLFFLFTLISSASIITAQENEIDTVGLLFNKFENAMVYYEGGLQSEEKVNFNFLDDTFYFIDKTDNYIKVVPSTENILSVKIIDENRRFIFDKEGLKEVLPTTPIIYVKYNAKVRTKASEGAYGKSETTSITSYSEVRDGGQLTIMKQKNREITNHYNYYWILKDGKKKKFTDFKGFLKIYSAHKEILKKYIEDGGINFEDVKAVANLCLYAESL